jgi:hypothetical protein
VAGFSPSRLPILEFRYGDTVDAAEVQARRVVDFLSAGSRSRLILSTALRHGPGAIVCTSCERLPVVGDEPARISLK